MADEWRRTNNWGTLTRAEIAAARDAGAMPVLTVGAVEQHADHLPVDTDSVSAYQIALRAAARCASPHVLVLPAPSFGFSPHHRAWPGTITLTLETFVGLVTDVVESLHQAGHRCGRKPAPDRLQTDADRQRTWRQPGPFDLRLHCAGKSWN
jgi:creatinine amidohydrolase